MARRGRMEELVPGSGVSGGRAPAGTGQGPGSLPATVPATGLSGVQPPAVSTSTGSSTQLHPRPGLSREVCLPLWGSLRCPQAAETMTPLSPPSQGARSCPAQLCHAQRLSPDPAGWEALKKPSEAEPGSFSPAEKLTTGLRSVRAPHGPRSQNVEWGGGCPAEARRGPTGGMGWLGLEEAPRQAPVCPHPRRSLGDGARAQCPRLPK